MRSTTFATVIVFACATGWVAGCDTREPPDVLELTNQGSLCIQNGTLFVDFETCLSSSCDTLAEASCSTNVANDTLSVTSYARIESQGENCTADCGFASAICETPNDPGGLTVAFGGDDVAFSDIPDCSL